MDETNRNYILSENVGFVIVKFLLIQGTCTTGTTRNGSLILCPHSPVTHTQTNIFQETWCHTQELLLLDHLKASTAGVVS